MGGHSIGTLNQWVDSSSSLLSGGRWEVSIFQIHTHIVCRFLMCKLGLPWCFAGLILAASLFERQGILKQPAASALGAKCGRWHLHPTHGPTKSHSLTNAYNVILQRKLGFGQSAQKEPQDSSGCE